ncbi:hypothetical protein Q8A67_018974 [Cirrhinus molitorella]|uniref:Uncharacterized protein n=1 Tax=Cirrhinus molitorella TaxID=172907 RepID=A0AA88PHE3_9TELE|nr:hypothetical protein Q8A67_018974 [Cirrhinus molitorella]
MAVGTRGGDRGNKTVLTRQSGALDGRGGHTGTGWTGRGMLGGPLEAERKTADGQDYSGLKYSHDSLRESRPEKLHLLGQFSIRRQTAGNTDKRTRHVRLHVFRGGHRQIRDRDAAKTVLTMTVYDL